MAPRVSGGGTRRCAPRLHLPALRARPRTPRSLSRSAPRRWPRMDVGMGAGGPRGGGGCGELRVGVWWAAGQWGWGGSCGALGLSVSPGHRCVQHSSVSLGRVCGVGETGGAHRDGGHTGMVCSHGWCTQGWCSHGAHTRVVLTRVVHTQVVHTVHMVMPTRVVHTRTAQLKMLLVGVLPAGPSRSSPAGRGQAPHPTTAARVAQPGAGPGRGAACRSAPRCGAVAVRAQRWHSPAGARCGGRDGAL